MTCKQISPRSPSFVLPTLPPWDQRRFSASPPCPTDPARPSQDPPPYALPARSSGRRCVLQGKERVRRRTPALSPSLATPLARAALRQVCLALDPRATARSAGFSLRARDPVRYCKARRDRIRHGGGSSSLNLSLFANLLTTQVAGGPRLRRAQAQSLRRAHASCQRRALQRRPGRAIPGPWDPEQRYHASYGWLPPVAGSAPIAAGPYRGATTQCLVFVGTHW